MALHEHRTALVAIPPWTDFDHVLHSRKSFGAEHGGRRLTRLIESLHHTTHRLMLPPSRVVEEI